MLIILATQIRFVTQSAVLFQIARFEIFETNDSESKELLRRYGVLSSILSLVLVNLATWMRFELTTSAVTGRHSNQLNYQAKIRHRA